MAIGKVAANSVNLDENFHGIGFFYGAALIGGGKTGKDMFYEECCPR
ncbi:MULTISPECIES: hypothetical protein [Bradyrhizobium]